MRSQEEYTHVIELLNDGRNDSEIARLTGIPRSTIRDWRGGGRVRYGSGRSLPCPVKAVPAGCYAYLLGLYLGDGHISRGGSGRAWRLRITMDTRYPAVIAECCRAMEEVLPGKQAHIQPRRSRCVDVSMYSQHWPCLFPQHGPGRKHERPIRLEDWQNEIVTLETRSFLRGLIHSDGCRIVANDRGVESVRYHFSNESEDIKLLYCAALDHLGIPWTRPCGRQIAVYRKAAVAMLDEFIGPKQ